jgi:hypothetical protein
MSNCAHTTASRKVAKYLPKMKHRLLYCTKKVTLNTKHTKIIGLSLKKDREIERKKEKR